MVKKIGAEVVGAEVPPGNNSGGHDPTEHKSWIFTINNFTDEDIKKIESSKFRYMCWAPEVGEEGTPHMQGFVMWGHGKTRKQITKWLPRAWTMPKSPNSTHQECIQYIQGPYEKDGKSKPLNPDFKEFGSRPKPGARHDLESVYDAIMHKRKRIQEVCEEDGGWPVFAKYPKSTMILQGWADKKVAIAKYKEGMKPYVTVLWGDTGSGKTRMVYEKHDAINVFRMVVGDGSKGSVWWDDYCGESVILLDDFRGSWPFEYLLQFLDRYPLRLQTKGGTCWRLCTHIYITSNEHPDSWYKNDRNIPLQRRLDEIILV